MAQGFVDPVLDRDLFELKYDTLEGLLGELRAIGANNARNDRARGLTGKTAWRRMRDAYKADRDGEGRYPATYEVVYLQALGPPPGRPRRTAVGEIATIPVSAIRRR
jgi:malonyl-CoA O-methyltransferase